MGTTQKERCAKNCVNMSHTTLKPYAKEQSFGHKCSTIVSLHLPEKQEIKTKSSPPCSEDLQE